jgi:hypothetical protein
MNTNNIPTDDFHTRQFEKFSAPRTFPAQWDLSELMRPDRSVQEPLETSDPGEQVSFSSDEEAVEMAEPGWSRDPFPQPRTFPSDWDLS